jgi:CBS domain-containing protein
MKAVDIMTRDPQTVTAAQPVADAIEIMKNENCGVVPVVSPEDGSSLVGIVTDRDIAMKACCDGGNGPTMPIVEAMSTNLYVVDPEDTLPRIRSIMEEAGVRRVPVVDNERLVGIISMKDIAENVTTREIGETDDRILTQEPNN